MSCRDSGIDAGYSAVVRRPAPQLGMGRVKGHSSVVDDSGRTLRGDSSMHGLHGVALTLGVVSLVASALTPVAVQAASRAGQEVPVAAAPGPVFLTPPRSPTCTDAVLVERVVRLELQLNVW